MSDPHNPLFDDEKEFLEQKKLEYERALRGDVAQIKEKTVQVGKFALAGAGVAGSVWVITRLMGHKKHRPRRFDFDNESGPNAAPPKGKKNKKGPKDPNAPKSAAASAAVFQEALGFDDEEVDRWPRRGPAAPQPAPAAHAEHHEPGPAAHEVVAPGAHEQSAVSPGSAAHEPDPFEPQPAAPPRPAAPKAKKGPKPDALHPRKPIFNAGTVETLGTLAKAAWQSETARGLFSQALAAGLAALAGHSAVKSAVEDAQAPKNPDLAARADAAAAGAGAAGPFSPAQPSPPDVPRQQPA